MDLLGIAQQGLLQAQDQFDRAGQRVTQASLQTNPSEPPADSVSLSDAMVSLLSASNHFETQVALAHAADDLEKATLNLLA